ncbi:aminopeptidase N [Puniceibacterium sp. IMCC21224]|uniref:aminopeptidase N n=1 Tax=Puniceibacterium sp. IMCC21224 TaxID=1618204 RepID=UPI00064DC8E2|nr:aminopeptidase N [Puniceibacterium sp. IMCC21224]KMK67858.1 aminopeptidase N [Puniceibacterium sp. IMCC21224]
MKDAAAEMTQETIYLEDYTPFGFVVEEVHLTFLLDPGATRVKSKISFAPNPDATDKTFFLHGEDLKLISAKINGKPVTADVTAQGLTCSVPTKPFVWESEVEIAPDKNTALEGLYMSNGMYCTQCEAEGFRKITYYPDRPDVMSTFTVRIEGPHNVLLSNGNPEKSGKNWAEWHDPWPKPSYLFALVAGELVNFPGSFRTCSGNKVELNIWVRPGDENKCAFGMEALKKSMRWDEEVYGREYDLDVFNIVAVDDFNMGAMENKGLNVFNSSCVLASPETSTDANFERIEAIIAHEYFHNWTGNRITCRDWFQLCLKEGLTVFRDSQFTSDMRSAPVKRIGDVMDLRGRQFPEDQGPLSHPVRPESFQEINNFYTATVYEKGAEVIGMLKRLVGDEGYAEALELYFARHDGQACTIENWLKVFEDVTGRDLSQFKRWYSQSGTPRLAVDEAYADGTYTLTFRQKTPPTPGQDEKLPQVLPIAVGLLNDNGDEVVETTLLEMTEAEQSFEFKGLSGKPVPSILRGFSAPVVLERASTHAERAFLLAHDTDPFNRWEVSYNLARDGLVAMVRDGAGPDLAWIDALAQVIRDDTLDPAFRELMLNGPSQSELAQVLFEAGTTPDPDAIWQASETLKQAMAERWSAFLPSLAEAAKVTDDYTPDAEQVGKRALGAAVLSLQTRLDGGAAAQAQFSGADNMTLQLSALSCLIRAGQETDALAAFEEQWQGDRLVMDKWFGLQIGATAPVNAAARAEALTGHAAFDWKNPNRFRAVFGALAMNHAGFHRKDGKGYALLADALIRLDAMNPQTTARMCSAFQTWRRYDADRQALMQAALERIAGQPNLSRDTTEMVSRILG